MIEEFHRIKRLPPYVFAEVNRLKAAGASAWRGHHRSRHGQSRSAGAEAHPRQADRDGRQAAHRPLFGLEGHSGAAARPGRLLRPPLRREAEPETQVVATLGSKEGFANMAQAITAPGDVVLVPNPSYPIHAFGFLMAGGVIRSVPAEPTPAVLPGARAGGDPLDPEADRGGRLLSGQPDRLYGEPRFLPRPRAVREEARHHHPVGSRLRRGLFRRHQAAAVGAAGAGRHGRDGRVHVDVEDVLDGRLAHGLRGRQRAAAGGARRGSRATSTTAPITPIQVAAAAALNGPDDCIKEMRATYKRRRDVLVESFGNAGWNFAPPTASMFAWVPVPEPFKEVGCARVLEAADREGRASPSRPASASASTARATCASPSSRTSSASGRRPARSSGSSSQGAATMHNVIPIRDKATG